MHWKILLKNESMRILNSLISFVDVTIVRKEKIVSVDC